MPKRRVLFLILIIMVVGSASPVYCASESKNESSPVGGWSSIDNIFSQADEKVMLKKEELGPIKIGFSAKEVQKVMGIPDYIDKEEYIYYYRQSPIYFSADWKVKSWDNRYGYLKVLPEKVEVKLGDHISQVFKEGGFPLRITKRDKSYQLDYSNQVIYLNERWLVEAIQTKNPTEYQSERTLMSLPDFIEELEDFLGKQ
ncbi:MAG: hypothetical protein KBI07_07765 [Candidatus Atribacteria bacterium]|nr:hypothetical protein [Candidatus Atribacteria bacterium]